MAARVLESGTSYAKALYLNIEHFDMALKSEVRISKLERKQNDLFTEINLLKKHIDDLKKRLNEKEKPEIKKGEEGEVFEDGGITVNAAGNKS